MTSTLEWLKSQPHEGKFDTVSDALNYQHAISILGPDEYLLYLHWVIEQKQAEIEKLRAAPKARPLEWEGNGFWSHGPDEGWMEEAITTFGWGYSIEFGREGNFQVDSTFDWSQDGFETPDDAKAAAQADYERRILEALE